MIISTFDLFSVKSDRLLGDRAWIARFKGVALNLPPLLAFAPAGTLFP